MWWDGHKLICVGPTDWPIVDALRVCGITDWLCLPALWKGCWSWGVPYVKGTVRSTLIDTPRTGMLWILMSGLVVLYNGLDVAGVHRPSPLSRSPCSAYGSGLECYPSGFDVVLGWNFSKDKDSLVKLHGSWFVNHRTWRHFAFLHTECCTCTPNQQTKMQETLHEIDAEVSVMQTL